MVVVDDCEWGAFGLLVVVVVFVEDFTTATNKYVILFTHYDNGCHPSIMLSRFAKSLIIVIFAMVSAIKRDLLFPT